MISHGYTRTTSNHCVFIKKFSNDNFIIHLLYVDFWHDASKIKKLERKLNKSFPMKDLAFGKKILGMEISHDKKQGKFWLPQ